MTDQRNDYAPNLPPETSFEFEDDFQVPWYEPLLQGLQRLVVPFFVIIVLLLAVLWGIWGSQLLAILRTAAAEVNP